MKYRHLTDSELQSYIDAEIIDDSGYIEFHLSTCDYCSSRLSQYEELFAELGNDDGCELSDDFSEKVISFIPAFSPPARKSVFSDSFLSIGGIIAAVAIFIYFIDWKSLLEIAEDINRRQVSIFTAGFQPVTDALPSLHLEPRFLGASVIILIIIMAADRVIFRHDSLRARNI